MRSVTNRPIALLYGVSACLIAACADPAPPDGTSYASNWELSIARAASVANAIRRGGYEQKIVAFGYAATQYDLLPNLDDAERRKLARRVDIIIMPTSRAF